jgi:stage II sporulation protein D
MLLGPKDPDMHPFRHLAIAGTLLGMIACSGAGHRVALPGDRTALSRDLRIRTTGGRIRVVGLEDYVQATVLGEFAPAAGDPSLVGRMLEVQAITSRTFAVANPGRHARDGFDLCATTHCQIYEPDRIGTSRWAAAARGAIARTSGTVLLYESGPAETVFHADCGGQTAAAAAVWGGTGRPYLVSRRDDLAIHMTWEYSMSIDEARAALNKDARTRIGNRLEVIEVLARDGSGRVSEVLIRGVRDLVVSGEELRRAIARTRGPRSIRSTMFAVRSAGETIVFSGRGFGHGVGLCQAGALARLRKGASPRAVLEHYFPGTRPGRL